MDKLRLSPPTVESLLKPIDQYSVHELQLERKAVRKLDYIILPVMTIYHLLSTLDRSNIGNARVAGLQHDLHLSDNQYQICISVFVGPYVAAELLSSFLVRKVGPRLLLPTVITIWGIIVTMQGVVTSYDGLVILRTFLGLFEGPLTPTLVIYLCSFYTRKELAFRLAIVLSGGSIANTFSGLLAAAIENMNGIGGRPGWAWIFILEGLLSVLAGIVGFFIIPSTLLDCQFLTKYEKELITRRLERDRPSIALGDRFSFKEVMRSPGSPHVIMVLIMSFMVGTLNSGLTLFLPSIIQQLGEFSANKTQLLTVGPSATAFFVTLITAFLSDRYTSRGITIAIVSMLAVAGFALYLSAEDKFTSYGALYLISSGAPGAGPVISAWLANNSEPHYRRATSVALHMICLNLGNILATWSFPTKDGPKFKKTTTMNLMFSILLVVSCLSNVTYLSWRNNVKKRPEIRAKLLEKYAAAGKQSDEKGLSAWIELGDRHPDFVYTL